MVEGRINTGQQTSSTTYFLYSGHRPKAPGSPGDLLCQFSFLTREVGLLDLQYAILIININDVSSFLWGDIFLIHSLLPKKKTSSFYLTLRRAELGKAGQQVTQRHGLLKKKSSNTADFPTSYTLLITCSLNPCRWQVSLDHHIFSRLQPIRN